MPQFVIEREILGAGSLSEAQIREVSLQSLQALNEIGPQIQWLHSYVTEDKVYCVYLAPDKSMIMQHANMGEFPANRIEEVKARHPSRERAGRGDGRDRQRGCIGSEDAVRPDHVLQGAKKFALCVEPLDDRFDDDLTAREIGERLGAAHAGERGIGDGPLDLAFRDELLERFPQVVSSGAYRFCIGVEQPHIESRRCGDLRNAASHGSGADNAERANRIEV